MTEYCEYASREGQCPTRSTNMALQHYDNILGANTAFMALDTKYCRNGGKDCPTRSHLEKRK